MPQQTVKVKPDITEIVKGVEYKGNISLSNCSLRYHLKFEVPLRDLRELAETNPVDDVVKKIGLYITDAKGRDV